MKKRILFFLVLISVISGKAQITSVVPNNATQGQTLSVTFTSNSIPFGMSTSCLHVDTSNIILTNATYSGVSYHAFHFWLADSLHLVAYFNFPSNATTGTYDASIGFGCYMTKSNVFNVLASPQPGDFTAAYSPSPAPGTSLVVTFTDNQNRFFNGATNCLSTDSSNILFIHNPSGVTYKPANSVSHYVDKEYFALDLPSNAPDGTYDIIAGQGSACPLHCYSCLTLSPNVIFPGQIIPNYGDIGQSKLITFTDNGNLFTQPCLGLDTTNIAFSSSWPQYGFNFHSKNYTIVNGDTLHASIQIPSNAPPGSYNVSVGTGFCAKSCQNCFTVSSNSTSNDLVVKYTANPQNVRPSHSVYHSVAVYNYSIFKIKPRVVITLDPNCNNSGIVNSIPFYDSVVNNKIYYTLDTLVGGNYKQINFYTYTTSTVSLGTVLKSYADVSPVAGDFNPANNSDTLRQLIQNSYDPNEKYVYPAGGITQQQVSSQMPLDYIVEFQNTGNAPAIEIVVVDTLSNYLDLSTFTFIASSHYSSYNLSSTGILTVTFHNIMLPDSTTDNMHSTGFFRYHVAPKITMQMGDVINNTAHIYFDNNSPVPTNTTSTPLASLAIKAPQGAGDNFILYPNPSAGYLFIKGPENTGGQIAVFDVTGSEVLSKSFNRVLEMENMDAGLYIVIIKDKTGAIVSAKKVMLKK
jgi:uncharacterized repeat protein (TIGR01451 family)